MPAACALVAAAALLVAGCTYNGRPFIEPVGPNDPPAQMPPPPPAAAAAMGGAESF